MNFLLAFFIGLIQNPSYRPNDFYCYDENGKAIGVALQPKILVKSDKLLFARLSKFDGIIGFENNVVKFVKIGYESVVLSALNELPQETLPVVIWKGRECVPTNIVMMETKSPVNIELLRKRLSGFGQFTIDKLFEISPSTYEMKISSLEMPSNIFVLANLIAEDFAYIKWARPVFRFLKDSVEVSMYVASGGLDSLGDKRFLHLDVHIFDDKISLLKDLMPQLGQNEFTLDEEMWFWADKPVITETRDGIERIISFVWPFIYLNTGEFTFGEINIPYSSMDGNEKTEKTILIKNCKFQIGSVLKGIDPPITDIQPMHNYIALSPDLNSADLLGTNYWHIYRPILAIISIGSAIFIWYHFLWKHFFEWIKLSRQKNLVIFENSVYWEDLLNAAKEPHADWKQHYQNIESRLRKALNRFNLDYDSGGLLKGIRTELERVYRDDGNPNSEDKELLVVNIKSFILMRQERS